MQQDMHTWTANDPENDQEMFYWEGCSGLQRGRHCVPPFLVLELNFEELHMLNGGLQNGLSSHRLGCRLACDPGGRFGCTLTEGSAQGMAAASATGLAVACVQSTRV